MPPGPVEDRSDLEASLAVAWDQLGGNDGGMAGHKLPDRTFDVKWLPPVLSFRIERHGAIVAGGSGYADVQSWEVNVDASTATLTTTRKRRVKPTKAKLDVEAIAVELANLIVAGAADRQLLWSGRKVQVRMAQALPPASRQTTEGRRKRLNQSLGVHLGIHGWTRGHGGWWTQEAGE